MSHWRLNEAGEIEPCTLHEWSEFFGSPRRFIADDRDEGGMWRVATFFEGFDAYGEGVPRFMTGVFRGGQFLDELSSGTRAQAMQAHADAVAIAKLWKP